MRNTILDINPLLIGTHGKVRPISPGEKTGMGSPYSYGAPMEIVPGGMSETQAAYGSIPDECRNRITIIIAGSQGKDGSQHLVKTAQMIKETNIFPQNPIIEEHPGAILPFVDLQEVFGREFVQIVKSHVDEWFRKEDEGTRQKITFKFLQALFQGKIESGIWIELGGKNTNLGLPQEIIEKSHTLRIRDVRTQINMQNRSNVSGLVKRTLEACNEGILIIASKEQVTEICEFRIKPENNKVYLSGPDGAEQISQ